jgi:GNAT superfamily N-acetyltransferase
MSDFQVRPLGDTEEDRDWAACLVNERWGADMAVAHGTVFYPSGLPGYIAWQSGERIGLVTYNLVGDACEIVTLDSLRPRSGIGTALIQAVRQTAEEAGCCRLWVITTNDNLEALRFYQTRGFVLVAVRPNALERSRRIKPEIPLIGKHGIPLRDEIELEISLE